MRHDWIFDVLTDLLAYAQDNGLSGLADCLSETLATARAELVEVPATMADATEAEIPVIPLPRGRPN